MSELTNAGHEIPYFTTPCQAGSIDTQRHGGNDKTHSHLSATQLALFASLNLDTASFRAGSIDKQRKTVGVKTDPKLVAAAAVQEHDGLTLETLKPGALVSAKVRSVLPDGLLLSFLTYFTGTVDRFHLDEDLPSADWAGRFSENQRLKARVLFVDPASKRVGLTLKPALVAGQTPQQVYVFFLFRLRFLGFESPEDSPFSSSVHAWLWRQ